MNGVKLLLIAAELSAVSCLIMLAFCLEVNCSHYIKASFITMFAIVAVLLQSMQQDIKWKI